MSFSYGYDEHIRNTSYDKNLEAFQRGRDEGGLDAFQRLVQFKYDTIFANQRTLLIKHDFLLGELTRATQPQNALDILYKNADTKRTKLNIQYDKDLFNIDAQEAREEFLLYCEGRQEYIDALNSIWPPTQWT